MVAPHESDDDRERQRRQLTDAPGDAAGRLLVGDRRDARPPSHRPVPAGRKQTGTRNQREAEEGVEGHRAEQDQQPQRVGRAMRRGVDTDEHRYEQVADDEEVHDHPLVADMIGGRPTEDRRVVEHPEGTRKQQGRDDGVCEEFERSRMHGQHDPLAGTSAAVLSLVDGAKGKRDGCGRHEQHGNSHRQHHMSGHVRAEQVLLVDVHPAAGDVKQHENAGNPENRAMDGPPVAPPVQPPHRGEVEEQTETAEQQPQDVDVPQREVIGETGGRGQRGARKQVGSGWVAGLRRWDLDLRVLGACQSGRDPFGQTHEREFGGDEPPEVLALLAWPRHPAKKEPALGHAEQAERANREHFDEHKDAVGGQQVGERPDANLGVHVARNGHHDETDQGDRRVPLDHNRDAPGLQLPSAQQNRNETAQPDRSEHNVQINGCRGRVVTGRIARVPLQRNRDKRQDRHDREQRDERLVANGKAHDGQTRGNESGRQPCLASGVIGHEVREHSTKLASEGDRLRVGVLHGEEAGDGGCHGPDPGARCGNIQRPPEFRLVCRESKAAQDECTDDARLAEVDESRRDRQAVTHQCARVDRNRRLGTTAVCQCREECCERDDEKGAGAHDARRAIHPMSLFASG